MMDFSTLVSALQNPEIYPGNPGRMDFVQTHVSAVFIAGNHVYKVKKPVDSRFLDFTTLEKRKFYCQQEVILDCQLCPEIYLGVVEIRLYQGRIFFGEGPGEIVEYAVFMKQLPQDRMLDRWLSRGSVTPALLHRVVANIVHFRAQADTNSGISYYGTIDTIRQNLEENFTQTENYIRLSVPAKFFREIKGNTDGSMKNNQRSWGGAFGPYSEKMKITLRSIQI